MTLLDHFHPPLSIERHWESFHGRWAAAIADSLNANLLPADYFAEFQVHVGSRVEIDVATFESVARDSNVGTATMPKVWTPPSPSLVVPTVFPDSLEILVFGSEAGPTLIAAIELVSPGNKDREEFRRAFAAKCASYLQQGVGLVIVDVVTSRGACLHNALVELIRVGGGEFDLPAHQALYATAYRPVRRAGEENLEVWVEPLEVGQALPVVALPLDKGVCVPIDLDTTYTEACRRSRLA